MLSGLPVLTGVEQLKPSDFEAAHAVATKQLRSASAGGDLDLIACARHQQGRIRLQQGQAETGLALLDETMSGSPPASCRLS